jgi:hypothetical protein
LRDQHIYTEIEGLWEYSPSGTGIATHAATHAF